MKLTIGDLNFVLARCPKDVVKLMREKRVYLGGGFIRETIAGNKPNDVDLFGDSKDALKSIALDFALRREAKIHTTDNAVTIMCPPRLPVQFITRWTFDRPEMCMESFDFTVCQAVIWFENGEFTSATHIGFYSDLAARRLVYTHPKRDEEAGGSLLRVRKFLARGYTIQAHALAGVIARIFMKVREGGMTHDEEGVTNVITGLLHEVDPLVIVDGVDYLDEHAVIVSAISDKEIIKDSQ